MTETLTYGRAFAQGLREEMTTNERIFVLGTDLFERGGHFAQVLGLGDDFGPERIRDAPISEAAMVAAGVGAALNGMRPVVDLNFIDFAFGAMDEVINQAAKIRYMLGAPVPLVIRGSAGVAGYAAQHNNQIESWFGQTPGLLVATPSTPADCKGLLKSALRGDDPVMFLMHKRLNGARGPVGGPGELIAFGEAAIRRPGSDVTIVSYGYMVERALKAAEQLAEEGTEAEVIDMRTVFPIDYERIEASVRKTGRLIVCSEEPRYGGVTAEVAAAIQESVFYYLDAPVVRVAARQAPVPHSPPLIDDIVPQQADIVRAVQFVMAGGRHVDA